MRQLNFPNAVESAADFFDRQFELSTIQQILKLPAQTPVVIQSERRIGKTSTLKVIIKWLEANPLCKVVRVPNIGSTLDEFVTEILEGICDAVGTNLHQAGLANEGEMYRLVSTNKFVRDVRKCLSGGQTFNFILCVDGFDGLLQSFDDRTTANKVRDLVLYLTEQTDLPLRFLLTMTRLTEQILKSYKSTFLHVAQLVALRPWSFEASCEFIG